MKDRVLDALRVVGVVLALLVVLVQIKPAGAADAIELQIDNGFGGHLYLTYDPCTLDMRPPMAEPLLAASSVLNEGTEQEQVVPLCWFSPHVDFTLVPEEYRGHVIRVVNVLVPDGRILSISMDRFEPAGTLPAVQGEF